jgi:two-component system, LytTR family, sensor kinase
MQRYKLHIFFWLAYIAQHTFLQIVHMHVFLNGFTPGKELSMALGATLIILPAKLPVTYFALYVLLPSILSDKKRILFPAIGMLTITAASVLAYWAAYHYFIDPFIYGSRENPAPPFVLYTWIATWDICSVAAIAVIIKFVRLQFQSREKERALLKEKLETELKFLRNQTNPHFLFNTLNNIYALALKKSDETPGFVLKLSKLLNFMLYESGKTRITIGDEMKILDDYIELEKIRYDSRLEIVFCREIDDEKEKIAPLLLLSFVENAFKHGASESRFKSYIHIYMKMRSGQLNFAIENTREACDKATHKCDKAAHNGNIGLANAKRQIELLYTDYELDVEDKKEFFRVNLTINLHSHGKI